MGQKEGAAAKRGLSVFHCIETPSLGVKFTSGSFPRKPHSALTLFLSLQLVHHTTTVALVRCKASQALAQHPNALHTCLSSTEELFPEQSISHLQNKHQRPEHQPSALTVLETATITKKETIYKVWEIWGTVGWGSTHAQARNSSLTHVRSSASGSCCKTCQEDRSRGKPNCPNPTSTNTKLFLRHHCIGSLTRHWGSVWSDQQPRLWMQVTNAGGYAAVSPAV